MVTESCLTACWSPAEQWTASYLLRLIRTVRSATAALSSASDACNSSVPKIGLTISRHALYLANVIDDRLVDK